MTRKMATTSCYSARNLASMLGFLGFRLNSKTFMKYEYHEGPEAAADLYSPGRPLFQARKTVLTRPKKAAKNKAVWRGPSGKGVA
jgi:hypothetical protein